VVVLASLGAGLGAPATTLAQGSGLLSQPGATTSPFTPGLPPSTPSVQTTSTVAPAISNTNTNGSDTGLSGSGAIAIAIGAVAVLGGISFFIWRDARKRAPIRRAAAATAGGDDRSRAGSKSRAKQRKLSPAERKRRKRGRAR
jgi:hypothetical protein